MSITRIADIPIKEDLSDIEKTEFNAFIEAMTEVETDWELIGAGENPDQKEILKIYNEIKERRDKQAEEAFQTRIKVIKEQVEREKRKIMEDEKENIKLLEERFFRSYEHSYEEKCRKIRDAFRNESDYLAFKQTHTISFPFDEKTMPKTRSSTEDARQILPPANVENEFKEIKRIIQKKHPL